MRRICCLLLAIITIHCSAKTIICPTAEQANKLFRNCKINVGKHSCGKKFKGTALVLNSTTEGLYGGKHKFHGFRSFISIAITDGFFYCKYNFKDRACKESWVVGSRYRLSKKCRLQNARRYRKIIYCKAKDPANCKITC